jgi:hypothetical protein
MMPQAKVSGRNIWKQRLIESRFAIYTNTVICTLSKLQNAYSQANGTTKA